MTPRPRPPRAGTVPAGGGSPAALPALAQAASGRAAGLVRPGPQTQAQKASVRLPAPRLSPLPPAATATTAARLHTAQVSHPQRTAAHAHPGATQTPGPRWDRALTTRLQEPLPPEVDFRQGPPNTAPVTQRPQARHVCPGQARAPGPIFRGPPLLAPVVVRALPCETG